MTTATTPPVPGAEHRARRIALIGNPNVGKSTLFGRLAGARVRTANFPGTTQSAEITRVGRHELVDLPGTYSLDDGSPEAALCRGVLAGRHDDETSRHADTPAHVPDAICVVADAANLARNLRLAGEAIRLGLPTVVVLNRIDQAERRGLIIDADALAERLGCDVLVTNGLTGQGVDAVLPALDRARVPARLPGDESLRDWAERNAGDVTGGNRAPRDEASTDRLDDLLTHPFVGTLVFAAVMTGLFYVVFKLATYPMDWIDAAFAWLADAASSVLPAGPIADLLANGVIAGVGATVIFLPQICLMFFLITLLEHSGYLPRAALLVDRLFRPFGLPGHAFVPLLSSHACAIPGIIACRGIPDRRERLASILIAPFMSCTARIPVYVLLTSLLFADRPAHAALAFTGCYVLGAVAGLVVAVVLRRTVLRGPASTMAIELPAYRRPSVRLALLTTWDRARIFIRKAGTVILGMVIALWWLGEYPHSPPPPQAIEIRERAESIAPTDPHAAELLIAEADSLEARHASAGSFMGRAGRAIAPVFAPLGYDWQLTIGVVSSFAAREVFVSTMAVVLQQDEDELETETGLDRIAAATRDDGITPVFTTRTGWSLLVFYILAMQCLPTLAVTARESGGWRWAALQFGVMTTLAYAGAFVAHHAAGLLG
jgi:ferrous iron transport protein B